ncbi:hypothetical protein GQ53DRAFT_28378 [Thozetella sp. PMI_491]|nr:hypothetical protein GQ53DRAFT_28378 [Thozetella sp. PMI_491]
MPFFEMPTEIEEPSPSSMKPTLLDFVKRVPSEPQGLQLVANKKRARDESSDKENFFTPPKPQSFTPAHGSPALTVSGSSPANADSPSPNPTPDRAEANALSPTRHSNTTTPSAQSATMSSATQPPAKKRKRLTEDEKKAKADAEAAKKQEKEAQKAVKAAELAKQEEEKRRKQEERDKKKREKEEADKVKAEEKRQRNEEKEQKKREKEEEEAKKARSQMRLTSMFFQKSTPKKETVVDADDDDRKNAVARASTPTRAKDKQLSWYQNTFRPFFLKDNVKLASKPFAMDEETTEAITRILDEHLEGKRTYEPQAFDPVEAFKLPFKPLPRGRAYPSVREIMAKYSGSSGNPIDLTARNGQILDAREALKAITLKTLKFREDVRPPYIGTVSSLPAGVDSLRKLARNPASRKVLSLDYEYDSEAEWQDDDGEDLENDEDDDEDLDEDEELEDFLDDSEDIGLTRPQFLGGMEPKSHGPTWENELRRGDEPHLYKYRMEFCLESLRHHQGIDPFSTEYWEPGKTATTTSAGNDTATPSAKPSDVPSTATNPSTAPSAPMAPPPAPTDAFHALTAGNAGKKAKTGLPPDLLEKLKELVRQNPKLSKMGVIELFKSQNKCPRAQIVISFDAITEKVTGKIRKIKGDD